MKLLVAFVQDADARKLILALTRDGFRVTTLASTGGLLRRGNTTVVSGVEDADVPRWIRIVDANCHERTEPLTYPGEPDFTPWYPPCMIEVQVGGATVFVLDVVGFERI